MKAIVQPKYGPPDVLELREVEKPSVEDGEVLVRVRAASVNPFDWHAMRGTPFPVRIMAGLFAPKRKIPGIDFAGTIEAVGGRVTRFQPGDDVFGVIPGAFAEYLSAPAAGLVPKPANLSYEEAAAVPVAALTALQCLRDKGRIRSGQRVLINGSSGGVGTFAVQIARSFGAEVTGVCSARNLDLVRSIGADHVIDYRQEDFTRKRARYDLILDAVGNHSLADCRGILDREGIYVAAAGAPTRMLWIALAGGKSMAAMITKPNRADLDFMKGLLEAGKVTPVIDRRYPLSEVAEALRYLEEGHARGKVVITV